MSNIDQSYTNLTKIHREERNKWDGKFLRLKKAYKGIQLYNNYPFMYKLLKNQGLQCSEQQRKEFVPQFNLLGLQMKKQQSQKDTQMDISSKIQPLGKNIPISDPEKSISFAEKSEGEVNWTQQVILQQINQQNLNNTKRSRSVFQNFQKHLITTLKVSIFLQPNFKNDPTVHLAHRMWNIFVKTNYFSKKILHFLFGVKSDIAPLLEPRIHPHFNSIAAVYPKDEIELAQEYLREQVVRQGNKLRSGNVFKNRRMRRGEEFESYFFTFLEELQNGGISRRLSKRLKNSRVNLIHLGDQLN